MKAFPVVFVALCRIGERPTKAWAPSKDAQIVVHRRIGFDNELFGDFILTHRRSGMAIPLWQYYYATRQCALVAAAKINGFPEWKRIGRPKAIGEKIPGWTKKLKKSLSSKLKAALKDC
jgi:hypothetical protein